MAPRPSKAIVHVVDDDASLGMAIKELLASVGLIARTYKAAGEFLSAEIPDTLGCVIIDVRLPDMNGLEFQNQLTKRGCHFPVIMITGHGDIPMSVRAMKGGAVDFLSKPFHDQDLLDAVLAALDRDRQRRSSEDDLEDMRQRFGTLSAREQQVMLLVASGKMNKQVAGELGISEVTVKIHRGAAMRKMNAHTFAALVRMADALNPTVRH